MKTEDGTELPLREQLADEKLSLNIVSKIEFIDSKGEVIESYFGSAGTWGGDCPTTYSQSYSVNSAAKSLKLRVTYFSKLESLKLPLDLKCGLGF